jgi:hypothetical protein
LICFFKIEDNTAASLAHLLLRGNVGDFFLPSAYAMDCRLVEAEPSSCCCRILLSVDLELHGLAGNVLILLWLVDALAMALAVADVQNRSRVDADNAYPKTGRHKK